MAIRSSRRSWDGLVQKRAHSLQERQPIIFWGRRKDQSRRSKWAFRPLSAHLSDLRTRSQGVQPPEIVGEAHQFPFQRYFIHSS
jgi:hypothetical protein